MKYTVDEIKYFKDKIILEISEGKSLRSLLKSDPENLPQKTIVYEWLRDDKEFADNYARAKMYSADEDAERVSDIVDMVERGELDANSARVMVDALKWTSGKKNPKKYNDRFILEGNSENPLNLSINLKDMVSFNDRSEPEI